VIILSSKKTEADKVFRVGAGSGWLHHKAVPVGGARGPAESRDQADGYQGWEGKNHLFRKTGSRFGVSRGDGKDKPVKLTPKEFDLLYTLLKKKNKVVSRAYLMESIWGYEYYGTTRTVDVHIRHLRYKLGGEGKRIETVESYGYRFCEDWSSIRIEFVTESFHGLISLASSLPSFWRSLLIAVSTARGVAEKFRSQIVSRR